MGGHARFLRPRAVQRHGRALHRAGRGRPLGRARSEVGDGLSPNLTSDEYSQNRCVGVAQCPLPSKETKIEENPQLRTPINRHRRPPGISSAAVELRVIEPRGRRRGDRAIRDFGASASFLRRRRSTRRLKSYSNRSTGNRSSGTRSPNRWSFSFRFGGRSWLLSMQHSIGCHHFARYLHDTVELSQLAVQLHVAEIAEAEVHMMF